jgi:uncharacterized phage protein (TIGR01671 family)
MREIKFRAWWGSVEKRNICPVSRIEQYTLKQLNEYNITVDQYTGLKDKNGKEIHEGDILSENIIVIFNDGCFKTTYDGDSQNGSVLGAKRCEHIEIIGNIHENPELLEELK